MASTSLETTTTTGRDAHSRRQKMAHMLEDMGRGVEEGDR
jgi:hypothetical protein